MTRKNDLTALLPFPQPTLPRRSERDLADDSVGGGSANRDRPVRTDRRNETSTPGSESTAGRGRTAIRLDQLDLVELVRHHAQRRALLRGDIGRPVGVTDLEENGLPAERSVTVSRGNRRRGGRSPRPPAARTQAGSVWGDPDRTVQQGVHRDPRATRAAGITSGSTPETGTDAVARAAVSPRLPGNSKSSSTAGAVQAEGAGFYLDLIGAVAVMALVLLAAILV